MKVINKLVLSLSVLFSVCSYGESIRIDDKNAPFFYESRAEIPAPNNKLAEYISTDYRQARDEFTKHDLFQKIKPVLTKRLTEAKQTSSVILKVGGSLGDYDFDQKSFSTGFSDSTFIPFDNGYAVSFTNGKDIEFLPVPMDSARSLSGHLRKSRKSSFDIYGEIVGAEEKKLRWNANKVIQVKITRIEVKLKSGKTIGSKKL
jgi:hypothetical protein